MKSVGILNEKETEINVFMILKYIEILKVKRYARGNTIYLLIQKRTSISRRKFEASSWLIPPTFSKIICKVVETLAAMDTSPQT